MIEVAVATGIPAREWRREGPRAIETAIDILHERLRQTGGDSHG